MYNIKGTMMGLGQIKRVARRTRFQLRFVTKSTSSSARVVPGLHPAVLEQYQVQSPVQYKQCSPFQCKHCNPVI